MTGTHQGPQNARYFLFFVSTTCSTVMFPIPHLKPLKTEDLPSILFSVIESERGEDAANAADPACQALEDLRAVIWETKATTEVRDGLLEYLSSINFVERTVSIKDEGFASALAVERIRFLFNMGICEANLAVGYSNEGDSATEKFEIGIRLFSQSASAFRHASEILTSPAFKNLKVPAVDESLTPVLFDCYEQLMFANCQHMRYLRAQHSGQGTASYYNYRARYAAGASYYYNSTFNHCSALSKKEKEQIGAPSLALAGYFKSLAEFCRGKACETKGEISEFKGRLRASREAIDSAYVNASQLVANESFSKKILDKISLLDREIFEINSSCVKQYSSIESDKSFLPIDILGEESFDIETRINSNPVNSSLQSLVTACPPNGVIHERTHEQARASNKTAPSEKSKELRSKHGAHGSAGGGYSSLANYFPSGNSRTILNIGDPSGSDDEGTTEISNVETNGKRILAVLTVLFLLRIILV